MITKKLNFTCITGKRLDRIRSPDGKEETEILASFIFTVPRKLSFEAAVRELRKQYNMDTVVKNSIYVDYEVHEYQISIEDFIRTATRIS